MKFYQRIAEYYDKIFPLNPKQVEFIQQEASGKALLEVGSATGSLAFALSKVFDTVIGIDLDQDLLRRAKALLPETHLQFKHLDMLNVQDEFQENQFDTVVCLGNTMAHLASDDQVLDFLEQVRYVLKPEGKLLLQIINFDRVIDQNASDLPLISNESIDFHRKYVYHEISNRIVFRSNLHIHASDEIISNQIPLLPIRKKSLQYMLKSAGFKNLSWYGSFQKTPFAVDCSVPLIVSAQ